MEELKRNKLRTDYGNQTGDKIRTEHYITYNHDYVHWLEDRLLKLLIIGDVSNNEVSVCDKCPVPYKGGKWLDLHCKGCKYFDGQTDC